MELKSQVTFIYKAHLKDESPLKLTNKIKNKYNEIKDFK